MTENVKDKAFSVAVSDEKVDKLSTNVTESASELPTYCRSSLIIAGNFNFIDRNILKIIMEKNERWTFKKAQEMIRNFKEGE